MKYDLSDSWTIYWMNCGSMSAARQLDTITNKQKYFIKMLIINALNSEIKELQTPVKCEWVIVELNIPSEMRSVKPGKELDPLCWSYKI